MRTLSLASLLCALLMAPSTLAQDLVVTAGATQTLSGIERYDHICVTGNSTLIVDPYDGNNRQESGNLELLAASIYVEAGSKIVARGAGYQTPLCSDGDGPTDRPGGDLVGGRGGCSVKDSGGGGAHFGVGGRGTVDAFDDGASGVLYFPVSFEDDCDYEYRPDLPEDSSCAQWGDNCYCSGYNDCGEDLSFAGGTCPDQRDGSFCRRGPTVAGQAYWHNVYDADFGGAGGDKGCRDRDGAMVTVGGAGGGRVVLAGLSHLRADLEQGPLGTAAGCGVNLMPGEVRIDGTLDAEGRRGCGYQNDSGGGGAGGTVLVVGERVDIRASAELTVAGGLGGDTDAKVNDPFGDCPAASQNPGGICDDCGGGGGGGIISILAVDSTIAPGARFDVAGADGGTCDICKGEAGGGAGELQLDGAYVGEYCDGYDNDFDGEVDEGLGSVLCGPDTCAIELPACTDGAPTQCTPEMDCKAERDGTRPRISVVLDSSASMLLDLSGNPTFGDGSLEYPGLSTDGDNEPDDARLYLAREAVAQVISAYPEVEFSLSRYHQDMGEARACQHAAWFECQDLIASYDDPRNNGGAVACTKDLSYLSSSQIRYPAENDTSHCINYAGSCGGPRRGADVLSGFGMPVRDVVRWLDGRETNFVAAAEPGNVCNHRQGGDCELRATGPTPLAGSLLAMEDFLGPIRSTDPAVPCRTYSVILVTDGAESCNGDPVAAARRLHDELDIEVRVIAVSVTDEEVDSLNAIASAGSGGTRSAIQVNQPEQLVPALTAIVAESIRAEICNDLDDDCDTKIDEDFIGKGDACDDGRFGVCNGTGQLVCNDDENDLICSIDIPGSATTDETCNAEDDDCDGRVDEGLTCTEGCVPETCNGADDDCDGSVDEGNPSGGAPCGQDLGACEAGTLACISGTLQCVDNRGPTGEICDGIDNDCDGEIDEEPTEGNAPPLCPEMTACLYGACRPECDANDEFPCQAVGLSCQEVPARQGTYYCIPESCPQCEVGEQCVEGECLDPCADVSCEDGKVCRGGDCLDCHSLGCSDGQLCFAGACVDDACAAVNCKDGERCQEGECAALCTCSDGTSCDALSECEDADCGGTSCERNAYCQDDTCQPDLCVGVTCLPGDTCVASMGCIDDPCPVVDCGESRVCATDVRGAPQCVVRTTPTGAADEEAPREVYVGTGKRGLFSCSVGNRGSAAIGLPIFAAVVLLLSRRRMRGQRKFYRRVR